MAEWKKEFKKWNSYTDLDPSLKEDLEKIKNDESALEDAFYQELTFGTGGIRGILGAGTNRLNIYTVRKAVNGLANYLAASGVNYKDRGVVVAYDSRYMSQEFALEVAKVLGVHGIRTYVFESLRPTPLLSFAVRYLGTVAGIMITASHNPSIYNGFKVYNEDGGQVTLEQADEVIAAVNASDDGLVIPVMEEDELVDKRLLEWVGSEVDNAYLEQLNKITKLDQETLEKDKDLKIVYSPLHGTGLGLVESGLDQLNFKDVTIVKEQAIPDPEFSTVDLPNPEEAQAFTYSIEQGKKNNSDILLATDPDADRLGVAVKDNNGEYTLLNGNQLGVLLLDYILEHSKPSILKNSRLITTIVTTTMGEAIANSYDVETINTLTGFKFIGEKIREYDSTGENFIFGFEESYGYLISSFARDKDAVQAVVMACEMAYYWKEKGKTLIDALDILYEKHGFYLEGMSQLTLKGIEGTAQIGTIMSAMRENKFTDIAGLHIEAVEDYLTSKRVYTDNPEEVETIDLPSENVVKFILEKDSWVCLRPSGTEPKIKCYYGVCSNSKAESKERLDKLQSTMDKMMDVIIGTN